MLKGVVRDMVLSDVVPMSLGIVVEESVVDPSEFADFDRSKPDILPGG